MTGGAVEKVGAVPIKLAGESGAAEAKSEAEEIADNFTPVPEELKYLPSIHLSNWLYMRPLKRLSLVDRP